MYPRSAIAPVMLSSLFVFGGVQLPGETLAIGQLQLGESDGYQTISFFNNTGPGSGCGAGGSEYLACTGIDITNWTLSITFTNQNSDDPSPSYNNSVSSPLVFSSGTDDTIGPFDGTNAYTGGSSGTWQIPLNFGNADEPACGPTCDYQISQITFSGTIDPSDLPIRLYNGQTYNGSNPSTYTVFNAQSSFSLTWNISPADYADLADPAFLSDQTDVVISDQAPAPTAPELSTNVLLLVGLLVLASFRRAHAPWRADGFKV